MTISTKQVYILTEEQRAKIIYILDSIAGTRAVANIIEQLPIANFVEQLPSISTGAEEKGEEKLEFEKVSEPESKE